MEDAERVWRWRKKQFVRAEVARLRAKKEETRARKLSVLHGVISQLNEIEANGIPRTRRTKGPNSVGGG